MSNQDCSVFMGKVKIPGDRELIEKLGDSHGL